MTRLNRDERGQITTAVVMIGIVVVAAMLVAVLKVGRATDEKSQVQVAADAAALAGAQQIRADLPGLILAVLDSRLGGDPFRGNACGAGVAAATGFASRADATVTSYCYFPATDTVRVSVDSMKNSVSGSPARATAEARVGVALGACDPLTPLPTPAPTPTPTATPSPTATPPPTTTPPSVADASFTVRCGDLSVEIMLDGVSGVIRMTPSESQIFDMFTPALRS